MGAMATTAFVERGHRVACKPGCLLPPLPIACSHLSTSTSARVGEGLPGTSGGVGRGRDDTSCAAGQEKGDRG